MDDGARAARLESWIAQWGTDVLRMCFVCLSDRGQAEDAMQETFLKAWRSMEKFEGRNGCSEKTWIMHIAMNVCRDQTRTRWFRHIDQSRALEDVTRQLDNAWPEEREMMLDIMALPDKFKQPILLYYYQNMTLAETAQTLAISTTAVHRRLRQAESMLKISLIGGACYDQ